MDGRMLFEAMAIKGAVLSVIALAKEKWRTHRAAQTGVGAENVTEGVESLATRAACAKLGC
jgi:hypothetical protein